MRRRSLLVICLVALAHSALFIVYQQRDWDSSWSDQAGYERLGAALATTGQFTRYPESREFIPEVIRTPGYPIFVAAVYKVFGIGNHMAVAIAQAFVFAGICLLVYLLARRALALKRAAAKTGRGPQRVEGADQKTAIIAALMTARPAAAASFGALVVTELWTAFVATAAMVVCLKAAGWEDSRLRDRRSAVRRHDAGPSGLRVAAVLPRDRAAARSRAQRRGRRSGMERARARRHPSRSRRGSPTTIMISAA